MNEDQVSAFKSYWADLVAQCEKTFPEAVEAVDLEGQTAAYVLAETPVGEQRKAWIGTLNAMLMLMQVADLEDGLWAKAIVFRWIWDWELAHPA